MIRVQNGLRSDSIEGRILHRSSDTKQRGSSIIAEVNSGTREKLLQLESLRIGWKICRVREYVSVLRCFKCCGYYYVAKFCTKDEVCRKCAEQHLTKTCSN
ncbi:hypothetical protein X777_10516 [Ooceraea biroi]|uniref:Uncharacterized protein n=1 Tax=Ooceraea biroi TaxID=2015173 RepID=A0A026W5X2_OOCBI|nr:hypothetical protein X777_10516 [Ooceraea biroi]